MLVRQYVTNFFKNLLVSFLSEICRSDRNTESGRNGLFRKSFFPSKMGKNGPE